MYKILHIPTAKYLIRREEIYKIGFKTKEMAEDFVKNRAACIDPPHYVFEYEKYVVFGYPVWPPGPTILSKHRLNQHEFEVVEEEDV